MIEQILVCEKNKKCGFFEIPKKSTMESFFLIESKNFKRNVSTEEFEATTKNYDKAKLRLRMLKGV